MSRRKSAEARLSPALRKGLVHIRSCEKSGETLKSYAERKGLSVRSLYDAKKKLRLQGILAPHGKPPAVPATPRVSQPPAQTRPPARRLARHSRTP